jgi:hypothetical protein
MLLFFLFRRGRLPDEAQVVVVGEVLLAGI